MTPARTLPKAQSTGGWCRRVTHVDSEHEVGVWLRQIGATDLRAVGRKRRGENHQPGPPDWLINYGGETIAVEVTLLRHQEDGWRRDTEIAVEKRLCELVERVSSEHGSPLAWWVLCEYAPDQLPNTTRNRKWVHPALGVLRRAAAAAPVALEERLPAIGKARDDGRGVVMYVAAAPANQNSGLVQVSNGRGHLVGTATVENVSALIARKTKKVRDSVARGERAKHYDKWWLVLDDELLMVPVLHEDEWEDVDRGIRRSPGIDTWSKVVLVNRFQPFHSRVPLNRWYRPFFEDTAEPPLPPCPEWGSYAGE